MLVLGPDVKEELPVLFLRLRHAVLNDGVKVVELASTPTGLTDELAAASLRYRPGHALPVVRALISGRDVDDEVGGVTPEALRAAAELMADGPITVIVGPRQPGRVGPVDRRRRGRRSTTRCPTSASSAPCAGPTCTAPSSWAWRPACCPVG